MTFPWAPRMGSQPYRVSRLPWPYREQPSNVKRWLASGGVLRTHAGQADETSIRRSALAEGTGTHSPTTPGSARNESRGDHKGRSYAEVDLGACCSSTHERRPNVSILRWDSAGCRQRGAAFDSARFLESSPGSGNHEGMKDPEETAESARIRIANRGDVPALAEMVNDFVRGHPAQDKHRPHGHLLAAYFGPKPVAEVLIAEWQGNVVGMIQWTRIYDMFWSMFGGLAEWLYVRPEARGLGLSAAMLALMAHRVREAGGEFIHGAGGAGTRSLFRRLAESSSDRYSYYLSAEAFQQVADMAHLEPREIVRKLPAPELSSVPARPRGRRS